MDGARKTWDNLTMPPKLHPYWVEEFERLQANLAEVVQLLARNSDQMSELVSMLRRREEQVKRLERENRKLREQLGIDPDPEPGREPVPEPETLEESDLLDGFTPGSVCDDLPKNCASTPATSRSCLGAPDGVALPLKKPRPRSRGGRRPPPASLPADSERHAVEECGACGDRVLKRDVLVTHVYTVVQAYVRARRIERERVICTSPDCNEATTARMPPMPCNRALYDCRFLAWLVVMKFVLLVPLDRIRTFLLARGVDIAMGTLVSLVERAAKLLDPIDGEHLEQLRAGAYICFDGTGLKTLIPGQPKAWDGYLEVFTRDELSVFQFDLTKHADRLVGRIRDYTGILVCDAETRNAAGAPGVTLANCNAHPLRAFEKAERSQPELAVAGRRFIDRLYEVEHEARNMTAAERTAYRRRHSRPILNEFRIWLTEIEQGRLPPSDPVRKVAVYYLKHFDDLTRFVDHGELPIDNNEAEREFQRHAKLRYASLFAGSPEGGHRWATILGVVRTAQKCGVDVEEYLVWVFERRGSHRREFAMSAAELTPMAYQDALREQRQVA